MTHLTFQIDYRAASGQQICICGSAPEMGAFDEKKAAVLSDNENRWSISLNLKSGGLLRYYYFVRENSTTVRREWGQNRALAIAANTSFFVADSWKDNPYHTYLYSSVFAHSVFFRTKDKTVAKYPTQGILLNVICPYAGKSQSVVISGENEALGQWDLNKALPLRCVRVGEWEIVIDASVIKPGTQYKFVIVDTQSRRAVYWEEGHNRLLNPTFALQAKGRVHAEMALVFRYTNFEYRGTGTAIPVFSLRTENSFGVGDFLDLKKMVDWVSLTHQQVIQILPINDTTTSRTRHDSYPYSAISIYALHPLFLNCSELPLKDKSKSEPYLEKAKELNNLPCVDYESVLKLKTDYSRDLFDETGPATLSSPAYRKFFADNEEWLFPYACYCHLRDKNQSAKFDQWGEFATYDKGRLARMLRRDAHATRETNYHCFIQYLLHNQLSEVKEYAHSMGVALKGDVPIGIHRHSVDAWTNTALFNMDTQTGAPPDDFSIYGQNWGFPTYNWNAMARQNYDWWKNRFRNMAGYFDAYRIDHILGFFRIWEIPVDAVYGLLGHFNPALPYWSEEIIQAGIPFDEKRMEQPFIHDDFLPQVFGPYTREVKDSYLSPADGPTYDLKSFCNTQQKIKHLFDEKNDPKSTHIRNGLYSLCCEVLFVRDRVEHNRFHPRITAQHTHSFQHLNDDAKNAFNQLYDDFFYRRHNYFWREQAMKKLPQLISSTPMMVCGEDLGMVPQCVPSVMHELQILSLEIQRMPKDPFVRFADLNHLPYMSVCTTSTHDMSPIRAWWRENKDDTQHYYNHILNHTGVAPADCTPQLCRQILLNHLQSKSMWVILPWQDWMAADPRLRRPNPAEERINVPSDPENYWCYRMHISLEELLKQTEFNDDVRNLSLRDRNRP